MPQTETREGETMRHSKGHITECMTTRSSPILGTSKLPTEVEFRKRCGEKMEGSGKKTRGGLGRRIRKYIPENRNLK